MNIFDELSYFELLYYRHGWRVLKKWRRGVLSIATHTTSSQRISRTHMATPLRTRLLRMATLPAGRPASGADIARRPSYFPAVSVRGCPVALSNIAVVVSITLRLSRGGSLSRTPITALPEFPPVVMLTKDRQVRKSQKELKKNRYTPRTISQRYPRQAQNVRT